MKTGKMISACILLVTAFSPVQITAESTNAVKRSLPPLAQKLPPLPPKANPEPVPPSRILARVNGVDITRATLDRQVELMAVLLKNKNPKITPQRLDLFKKKNLKRISNDMVRRIMLSTCLEPSNIVVSAEMRKSVEQDFAQNYGAKKQSFEKLRGVVEGAGYLKEFEDNLRLEALIKTFVTTVYSNRYYVSDTDILKYRKDVEDFNVMANATNAFNRAMAAKVAERARKGEDFARLADEFSQDPGKNPGGLIGQCDEHDFEDAKHVWLAVASLKTGGVTDVIDLEDGYAVFHVNKRLSAEETETGEEALLLSRIFFRRAFTFPPQSDEDFRADIEKELRQALFKDIIVAFRRQSKIEYPEGVVENY